MNFQELRVYQLSEKLSDDIWQIVNKWDFYAKDTVGKQMTRAVDSVGANIAEGAGRGSYQDNKRFVKIARGSLNETQYWVKRAYTRQLINIEQFNEIKIRLDELAPKLNAYLNSIGTTTANKSNSSTNH